MGHRVPAIDARCHSRVDFPGNELPHSGQTFWLIALSFVRALCGKRTIPGSSTCGLPLSMKGLSTQTVGNVAPMPYPQRFCYCSGGPADEIAPGSWRRLRRLCLRSCPAIGVVCRRRTDSSAAEGARPP